MRFLSAAILLGSLFSLSAWSLPATIVNEGAVVFVQPDFDSDAKMSLHEGDVVEVSQRSFPGKNSMGAFRRVKMANGQMGFISDAEFKVSGEVAGDKSKKNDLAVKKDHPKESPKKPKQRAFASTRFRGVSIDYVGYKEQTMGLQPMSNSVFYGFKMVGPDILVDGEMVTEFNANLLPSAPAFYQQGTGNSASGWNLHMDMIFESIFPQTENIITYVGFGPMLKYDHYQVSLSSNGKSNAYDLDDINVGAVFNAGFGVRVGKNCLRAEFKYDWEKTQYWGLGTSFLFPF